MASPEKATIMALIALVIIHGTAIYAASPEDWNAVSNKLQSNMDLNHEKLKELDEQSSWIQRAGTSAIVRLNDFWDGIKASVSFIWLFTTAPYKVAITHMSSGGLVEDVLADGLIFVSIGLTTILGLNLYLIIFNKKT